MIWWKHKLKQTYGSWYEKNASVNCCLFGLMTSMALSPRELIVFLCANGVSDQVGMPNIQLSHETLYYNNNYRALFRFTVSIRTPTYSMLTKRSHQCHWHDEIHTQNELRQHQLSRACWLFTTYKLYTLLFS